MSRHLPQTLSATLILYFSFLAAAPADGFLNTPIHPTGISRPGLPNLAAVSGFARLPLSFVPNAGQTDPAVRFQAYGMAGALSFTPDEVLLSLPTSKQQPKASNLHSSVAHRGSPTVRLRFVGASAEPHIVGTDRRPGIVNYFIGNDPTAWRTNVPTYAGIVYRQLYPGIDIHYAGTRGALKGTFAIAPGADPNQIRWRYIGAKSVEVDETSGDLLIALPTATDLDITQSEILSPTSGIVEHAPMAWQTTVAVAHVQGYRGGLSVAIRCE